MVTMVGKRVKQVNNLVITLDKFGVYRVYDPNKQCLYNTRSLNDAIDKCSKCKGYLKVRTSKSEVKQPVNKLSNKLVTFIKNDNRDKVAQELLKKVCENCAEARLEYDKTSETFNIKIGKNLKSLEEELKYYLCYHLADNDIEDELSDEESDKVFEVYFKKYYPISRTLSKIIIKYLANSRSTYNTIAEGYLHSIGKSEDELLNEMHKYAKSGDFEPKDAGEEFYHAMEYNVDDEPYEEFNKKYSDEINKYIESIDVKSSNAGKVLKKLIQDYLYNEVDELEYVEYIFGDYVGYDAYEDYCNDHFEYLQELEEDYREKREQGYFADWEYDQMKEREYLDAEYIRNLEE